MKLDLQLCIITTKIDIGESAIHALFRGGSLQSNCLRCNWKN